MPDQIPSTRIVANHLVRETPRGLELLDTGSPISIPVPEEARRHVHPDLTRLVGMDELGAQPFLLDWDRGLFVPGHPAPEIAESAELKLRMAIPTTMIDVVANGRSQCAVAILDTGAPICYAPSGAVRGFSAVGELTDFYPGIGEFTTTLYEARIAFLRREQAIRVGVLPALLQMALSLLANDAWILGGDFFTGRRLWVDPQGGRISQLAGAPTPTS